MTEENYNSLITRLLSMFDELDDMEASNTDLSNTVKKANAMVAISKVCLQTEVLKRACNNVRNNLTQNVSRLSLEPGEENEDIIITNN